MTKKFNPFTSGADEYDSWFDENKELLRSEIDTIGKVFDPEKKTVEIGAGTGVFSKAFGIDTGVEPSRDMARIAVSRGIRIVSGSAEDLPLPGASFGQALMVTVDCFLSDMDRAFRETARVLTERGVFVIAFLNLAAKLGQFYEDTKDMDRNYRYAVFHTDSDIRRALTAAGFTVAEEWQSIDTLDNIYQAPEPGCGRCLFTVFKAVKI